LLIGILVLLRFSYVTTFIYTNLVKDPVRVVPDGRVITSPADGTVLYVRRIEHGIITEITKEGVQVPVFEHLKTGPRDSDFSGYLIGIYMSTQDVHINRIPLAGRVEEIHIHNGPHMDMTEAESKIILTQLVPGWITIKKLLGMEPFDIANETDYILKSARETIRIHDIRDRSIYVIRIADYFVGKVLTWISEKQEVETGQKMGMVVWGSQTDILIADSPGLRITAEVGEHVLGGESVIATF